MEFPGFPFINKRSFVKHTDVLQYLEDYTNHYNIRRCIKFLHHVKNVVPTNDKWQITYTNLLESTEAVEEFDSVIICNGHNSVPYMGDFPGITEFEGEVKHSHSYRHPELYSNKTVLVCGGGPSGVDITFDIAEFASKVYFTHRNKIQQNAFPENVEEVPEVKTVRKNSVEFVNGSISEQLDIILLCTGYKYTFPFLAPECGITVVEDKFVQPLHKDIININHPTMGFIGLPFNAVVFPLFDYQVRFYLKTLKGEVLLPCRDSLLADLEKEISQNQEKGVPVRKYQQLGNKMRAYLEYLADAAQLEYLPPVVYKIYEETANLRQTILASYRNVMFHIIDNDNYKVTVLEDSAT